MPKGRQRGFTRRVGFYGRYKYGVGKRTEVKFKNIKSSIAIQTNAAVINSGSILNLVQGVQEDQRVGRNCVILKVEFNGTLTMPKEADGSKTGNVWRYILFLDRQCNGATAAAGNILEDPNQITSHYNLKEQGRFKILYDTGLKVINPSAGAFAGVNAEYCATKQKLSFMVPCNAMIEYAGTTGNITEIRSNNIGQLVICQNIDNDPLLVYTVRVRYVDS